MIGLNCMPEQQRSSDVVSDASRDRRWGELSSASAEEKQTSKLIIPEYEVSLGSGAVAAYLLCDNETNEATVLGNCVARGQLVCVSVP